MINILFVINPAAGNRRHGINEEAISKHFPDAHYNITIKYTDGPGNAGEIARSMREQADTVVAVGGDGTINEIAGTLIHTHAALAILPAGSGNGLARSLNIPMSVKKALDVIKAGTTSYIDAVKINDHYFFNMAGVGFDAYIARLFDGRKKRGLNGYVKVVMQKFFKYKGKKFEIHLNGDHYHEQAFLVSFANSSQYGNNAHIAPNAKLDDGKFNLCIVRDFPRWQTPVLAWQLFSKKIDRSPFYLSRVTEELVLNTDGDVWTHLDGEPHVFRDELRLSIEPAALKVITG